VVSRTEPGTKTFENHARSVMAGLRSSFSELVDSFPGGTEAGPTELGRMLSVAAARLGFKTCIFEPAGDCPASLDRHHSADFNSDRGLGDQPHPDQRQPDQVV